MKIIVQGNTAQQRDYASTVIAEAMASHTDQTITREAVDETDTTELREKGGSWLKEEEISILKMPDAEDKEGTLKLLEYKLENGICHFGFKKKDGSLREAFGTKNAGFMPDLRSKFVPSLIDIANFAAGLGQADHAVALPALITLSQETVDAMKPKEKKERATNADVINYFDLEVQDWRACRRDSVVLVY